MNTSQRTKNVEIKARVLLLNIIRFCPNARYHTLFPLLQTVDRIRANKHDYKGYISLAQHANNHDDN
jgi:hypothetical protein